MEAALKRDVKTSAFTKSIYKLFCSLSFLIYMKPSRGYFKIADEVWTFGCSEPFLPIKFFDLSIPYLGSSHILRNQARGARLT